MEYRLLGRTGVRVSPLCLGALNFGDPTPEPEAIALLHHALAQGINFVDTSNSYGRGNSESIVGRALSGGRRQHVVLATKFHFAQSEDVNDRGNSRRHIIAALDDSLRRLQTDWVDLYQCTGRSLIWRKTRRCALWMMWCVPARCATLAVPAFRRGW